MGYHEAYIQWKYAMIIKNWFRLCNNVSYNLDVVLGVSVVVIFVKN